MRVMGFVTEQGRGTERGPTMLTTSCVIAGRSHTMVCVSPWTSLISCEALRPRWALYPFSCPGGGGEVVVPRRSSHEPARRGIASGTSGALRPEALVGGHGPKLKAVLQVQAA